MSIQVTSETAPAAPSTSTDSKIFTDSSSNNRLAVKDAAGNVMYCNARQAANFIINGGLAFWQRQTPGTYTTYSTTTTRLYGIDRFGITNENASTQIKRVDTVAAAETGLTTRYYASVKKITATGKIIVSQVIPGDISFPCRGRYVRFSAKLRVISGSSAATMRMGVLALSSSGTVDTMPATFASAFGSNSTDPTWGTNLSAISPSTVETGTISGNGISCALSGTWQRFSGSFLVPAGTQNLVAVIFSDSQITTNDEFGFAEVMVTDGQDIRDWIPDDPNTTLMECQRYCWKTFAVDTGPAQSVGADTGELQWVNTVAAAATNRSPGFRYPYPMRAAPTQTFYNPSAANALIRDETVPGDTTSNSVVGNNTTGFRLTYTGHASGTVGGLAGVHVLAEAEI